MGTRINKGDEVRLRFLDHVEDSSHVLEFMCMVECLRSLLRTTLSIVGAIPILTIRIGRVILNIFRCFEKLLRM